MSLGVFICLCKLVTLNDFKTRNTANLFVQWWLVTMWPRFMYNHAGTLAGSGDVNAFIFYFHCDRTVLNSPTMLVVDWKKLMLVHFSWSWQTFSHICHWQQTCAQWFCHQFVSSAETNLYLPGSSSGSPAFSCSGWKLEHFTSDARDPLKDKAELNHKVFFILTFFTEIFAEILLQAVSILNLQQWDLQSLING